MVWLCGPPWRPGKTAELIFSPRSYITLSPLAVVFWTPKRCYFTIPCMLMHYNLLIRYEFSFTTSYFEIRHLFPHHNFSHQSVPELYGVFHPNINSYLCDRRWELLVVHAATCEWLLSRYPRTQMAMDRVLRQLFQRYAPYLPSSKLQPKSSRE